MPMFVRFLLLVTASFSLAAYGCGKGKSGGKGGGKGGGASLCKEKNGLTLTWSDKEKVNLKSFKLKKTLAYISGMRYNAKSTAKLLYIVFANYDVGLGPYSPKMPAKPGEAFFMIDFKTESKTVKFAESKKTYDGLTVPKGEFKPGWMEPGQSFQVSYFSHPKRGGEVLTGSKVKGKAVLTYSDSKHACGSVELTTANGSVIKGTFNVPIAKDLWNK